MRGKLFILCGLVALLLGPGSALTQPGGRQGGNNPGGSGRDRGNRGQGMMGGQGMTGGQGVLGGQGMTGRGMMGGQGTADPSAFFNQLSGGKDFWSRNEITDDRQRTMFDMMAQRMVPPVTNGVITRQQFEDSSKQFLAQMGNRTPGGPGQGGNPQGGRGQGGLNWNPEFAAESMFRQLDQNGDGVLNYDEMSDSLRQEKDKFDTNMDGVIDLAEFKEYFKARMAQIQTERGGQWGNPNDPIEEEDKKPVVWRAGKLPKELPPWFRQMDTDNDGQVGLYEWKRAGGKVDDFFAIDINSDGFITVEEALRSVGKLNTATLAANDQSDPTQPGYGGPRGGGRPGGNQGAGPGSGRFQMPGAGQGAPGSGRFQMPGAGQGTPGTGRFQMPGAGQGVVPGSNPGNVPGAGRNQRRPGGNPATPPGAPGNDGNSGDLDY